MNCGDNRRRSAWQRLVIGFCRSTEGNFGLIFSLVFTTLVFAAGLGLDYANAVRIRSQLQNALDSATVGAVSQKIDTAERIKLAGQLFGANIAGIDAQAVTPSFEMNSDGVLVGKVGAATKTIFMSMAGIDQVPISVRSGAIRGPQEGRPLCIMAMHPTRKHTLELDEKVSIYGPDCHIYGNSNNVDDVVDPHTPDNYVTGASVTAVGYGHHYIQNVTPPLEGSVDVVADPFLAKSLPAVGLCTFTGTHISAKKVTLDPGTYCNGLTIDNNSEVTLNPGIYTITGRELSISNSKVSGNGVTIYLSDRHAEMDIENSVLRLVAPTGGDWRSFVVLGKRESNAHVFKNSTIDLYGIVYIPKGAIDWTNTGTPEITAQWAAWITDGFSWHGNGTINFPFKINGATVPYPKGLNVIPRPSIKEVVRMVF